MRKTKHRDVPLSKSPDTGERQVYGKKLSETESATSKLAREVEESPTPELSPSVRRGVQKENIGPRVSGYAGGSGTKGSMSAGAGVSYRVSKNFSINADGYGGKDEGGKYYGYSVTGNLSIPINRKKK